MEDVSLLRPLWLIALPALVVLAVVMRRRRAGLGDWDRVLDPAMLRALRALGHVDEARSARRGLMALIAAGLVVVALAGPALERRDAAAFRNLDGVIFAIDASSSMVESPRWPALQTMGRFGISALGSRPAALLVFGGDSYVVSDMTGDLRQLGQTLSLIDAETVPDKGSRPERALAEAALILDEADVLAGDVVLFTDGGGLGQAAMAKAGELAARGARVSVVSLDDPGPEVQTLVATGQGRVFTLNETDAFAAFLAQDARDRLEKQDYPLLFWSDYGRFLLLVALIPVLLLFRRRGVA
ncbi:vWA domain-containing protein [Puniceibacterium sediminis]|uniref:Ca-activated chloride channel family protein n=1 Tax=Puniceibacterium sediminis TaxID=1608407 RepID=A0A238Y8P5_9RHOB|nr:vWA domain-containing protein [Puniceibacterium sediminis]SNR67121.1 Ca-activated chloride channel family protein [Puniceibacterium sediminis]